MWRKALLVFGILVVGCTAGRKFVPNITQQGLTFDENTDLGKTQVSNSFIHTQVEEQPPNSLPNLGAAPEWTNDVWLNTDKPLFIKDLRGSVVLLEMWTFG